MTFEVLDGTEYKYAIEHPREAFADLDLQRMRPKKTSMGGPKVCVGGFAMVFELVGRDQANNKELRRAVRCFKRLPSDLAIRYQEISQTLERISQESDFFLSTRYIEKGILIEDGWRPITTLQWVDGLAFDEAFDEAHQDRVRMDRLVAQIRKLSTDFERWGIAHGDLQHGNIIVTAEGRIKLIDYDGMYVPGLRGQHANEAGHPDFRHPDRGRPERQAELFYPGLDRFALITLYLQTVAVTLHPELWAHKRLTDGLLLREADYLDPDGSETLAAFREHEDLRRPTDLFRRVCAGPIEDVPRLVSFISESGIYVPKGADVPAAPPQTRVKPTIAPPPVVMTQIATPKPAPALPPRPAPGRDWSRLRVLDASPANLRPHVKQEVVLVGEIVSARPTRILGGATSLTLELKSMGREPVKVVVDEVIARSYGDLGDLSRLAEGTWIAVRGHLSYRLAWIVSVGEDAIELIDKAEAGRRVSQGRPRPTTGSPNAARPAEGAGHSKSIQSTAQQPTAAKKSATKAKSVGPAKHAATAIARTQENAPVVPAKPMEQSPEVDRWDALSQLLKIR